MYVNQVLHLSTGTRIIAVFGDTFIDMPFDAYTNNTSHRQLESSLFEFTIHENFGFVSNGFLVIIGGPIGGIDTYIKYVGRKSDKRIIDKDGWIGRPEKMQDTHFTSHERKRLLDITVGSASPICLGCVTQPPFLI